MNRIFNYNSGRFISRPIEFERVEIDSVPDTPEPAHQLLDMIYSRDPVTGLPCGDLAIFLNDKANPEVKAFIEQSLMKDITNQGDALSIPQDVLNEAKRVIGDDDIAFFGRAHGETPEEFASRMNKYFDCQRVRVAELQKFEQLKKVMLASKDN